MLAMSDVSQRNMHRARRIAFSCALLSHRVSRSQCTHSRADRHLGGFQSEETALLCGQSHACLFGHCARDAVGTRLLVTGRSGSSLRWCWLLKVVGWTHLLASGSWSFLAGLPFASSSRCCLSPQGYFSNAT